MVIYEKKFDKINVNGCTGFFMPNYQVSGGKFDRPLADILGNTENVLVSNVWDEYHKDWS